MIDNLVPYIVVLFIVITFCYYQITESSSSWSLEQDDCGVDKKRRRLKRLSGETAFGGQYRAMISALPSFLFGTAECYNDEQSKNMSSTALCSVHNDNNNGEMINASRDCCCRQNTKQLSNPKFEETVIEYLPSDNFIFIRCPDVPSTDERRLLILFAWLFAKQRHLDKYRKLYLEQGFDVLTVVVHVRDFLLPQSGSQRVAADIVHFLRDHESHYRDYVFHAFSVGAYQMGELFVMLGKECNKELMASTKSKLRGLVYDSAMDVDEAPIGLSKATTDNALLQWGISTLMYAHLRFSYHISTRHYIKSSETVKNNVMGVPALVLMSKDDVVCNYRQQIKVCEKWQQQGSDVMYKCWDQSPHVSHFFKHREEYIELVQNFLQRVLEV